MEIGELIALVGPSAPVRSTTWHAIVLLRSLSFAGNHVIDEDTTGTFGAPEWLRGRPRQFPVCYTRGRSVRITPVFDVLMSPSATETLTIRARLVIGSNALEWQGTVSCAPGATTVSPGELVSSGPLPNEVACVDPASIEFFAAAPGEAFSSAGASNNVLYVVLGDPAGTPAYWTLLDVSCRAAAGATSAAQVIARSFLPFTSRTLTRLRDRQGLTYWNPDTTTCTNTRELLASTDGSGQCGSWAELLIDMYKAHGIAGQEKVLIVRTLPDWQASRIGFLVKNWDFVGAGSRPAPFTHEMFSECRNLPGIPGQRNPEPPPGFFNHFIVRASGSFYDPSYGAGGIASAPVWETGAIDGLFAGSSCGFPKAAHPSPLLEFFNADTLAPL